MQGTAFGAILTSPAPWPHGLTPAGVETPVNLACDSRPPVRLPMNSPHVVVAQPLDRAAVRAQSLALCALSLEIRQESRVAIETSKLLLARSQIELARARAMHRTLECATPVHESSQSAARRARGEAECCSQESATLFEHGSRRPVMNARRSITRGLDLPAAALTAELSGPALSPS